MSQARVAGGVIRLGRDAWQVSLGRGGVRADKQEGDGATPLGLLPLRRVFYRADRGPAPRCSVPAEPLAPTMGGAMTRRMPATTPGCGCPTLPGMRCCGARTHSTT